MVRTAWVQLQPADFKMPMRQELESLEHSEIVGRGGAVIQRAGRDASGIVNWGGETVYLPVLSLKSLCKFCWLAADAKAR